MDGTSTVGRAGTAEAPHGEDGEATASALLDQVPVGVVVVDDDGRVRVANAGWTVLAGRSHEGSRTGAPDWLCVVHPDDRAAARALLADVRRRGEAGTRLRTTGFAEETSTFTQVRGRRLAGSLSVLTFTEVEDGAGPDAHLRHLLTRDALTGALNRVAFLDRVEASLAEGGDPPGRTGVLFVDLDGFKAVNDRHGHHTGDQVLVAACARMHATLRPSDSLGRLGGDEFGVVVPGLGVGAGPVLCARLVEVLAAPFSVEGRTVTIGASVGLACSDGRTRDAVELLRRADRAMYAAKAAGGSRHATATSGPGRRDDGCP